MQPDLQVPICFFMPIDRYPAVIPEQIETYQTEFKDDIYAWTLQTYVYLKNSGLSCSLVREMPQAGIVVAHRDCLVPDNYLNPHPDVLLVCIQSNRQRLSYAQLHVVQNPYLAKQITQGYFIPPWSTPGLQPRDPKRGDRFENVVYIGHLNDLATELKHYSFRERVRSLGLSWQVQIHNPFDYSNVDAVLAVRNFSPAIDHQTEHFISESAIKLHDAWLAGVPVILGHECAYQFMRQQELDYLEANQVEDVVSILNRLQTDLDFRQATIRAGKLRVQSITQQSLVAKWHHFFEQVAIPSYQEWCSRSSIDRSNALEQHKADIDQRNQQLEARQQVISQLRTAASPYDLGEKP